jgi:hypothetical protein
MKTYGWITNLTIGVLALACSDVVLAENQFYTLNLDETKTYSRVSDAGGCADTGILAVDETAFINMSLFDAEISSSDTLHDFSSFSIISGTGFTASFDALTSYVFSLGGSGLDEYIFTLKDFSNEAWVSASYVEVNDVALPAATWLFSALLGFAAFSSRRSV